MRPKISTTTAPRGLGDAFIEEFNSQLARITDHPHRWMIVRGDVRRALMRRFPYVIYFRMLEPDNLRIIVVRHQRRHPGHGTNRH